MTNHSWVFFTSASICSSHYLCGALKRKRLASQVHGSMGPFESTRKSCISQRKAPFVVPSLARGTVV